MKIIMYKLKIFFYIYINIWLSFLLIQIMLLLIACFLPLLSDTYDTLSLPDNELYECCSKITYFCFQMPPGTDSALPPSYLQGRDM